MFLMHGLQAWLGRLGGLGWLAGQLADRLAWLAGLACNPRHQKLKKTCMFSILFVRSIKNMQVFQCFLIRRAPRLA